MGRCYHLPTNLPTYLHTYLHTYLPTSFTLKTVRDGDGVWRSPFGRREVSLAREQKQPRFGGKREREMEHGHGGGGDANAGSDSKKPTSREKTREKPQLSSLDWLGWWWWW